MRAARNGKRLNQEVFRLLIDHGITLGLTQWSDLATYFKDSLQLNKDDLIDLCTTGEVAAGLVKEFGEGSLALLHHTSPHRYVPGGEGCGRGAY